MAQIKVVITDDRINSESVEGSTSGSINKKNGKLIDSSVKKNDTASKSLAIASMVAHQSFNYMVSNVGKWTGSSRTQNNVNNVMQLISIGAIAYINPILAVANVGMNMATTALNNAYEQKWDAMQKEYNKARVGELKGFGH